MGSCTWCCVALGSCVCDVELLLALSLWAVCVLCGRLDPIVITARLEKGFIGGWRLLLP